MSFKDNLLKKIQIRQLTLKVIASFGAPESGSKIDKDAMRGLLELSPYQYQRERDLDLYLEKLDGEQNKILVLDNELPIYRTTVEDVAIRKSPFTKEMLRIGNIIKILRDSDVKVSRKEESVQIVAKACIERLDLAYTAADIDAIAKEGADSLENGYTDGILESLALFAELLGYRPPPKAFELRHHEIFGALTEKAAGEAVFGPIVIFSLVDNALGMLSDQISSFDKPQMEHFRQVAQGKAKAAVEGGKVFEYLAKAILGRSV